MCVWSMRLRVVCEGSVWVSECGCECGCGTVGVPCDNWLRGNVSEVQRKKRMKKNNFPGFSLRISVHEVVVILQEHPCLILPSEHVMQIIDNDRSGLEMYPNHLGATTYVRCDLCIILRVTTLLY